MRGNQRCGPVAQYETNMYQANWHQSCLIYSVTIKTVIKIRQKKFFDNSFGPVSIPTSAYNNTED